MLWQTNLSYSIERGGLWREVHAEAILFVEEAGMFLYKRFDYSPYEFY